MKERDLKARNDEKHIAERLYSTRLKVTAGGIVILGFWAVIQSLLSSFSIADFYKDTDFHNHPFLVAAVVVIMLILFTFFVLSFRLIILRGAKKEADGRIKKNGYLVVAVYLMLVGLYSSGYFVYRLLGDGDVSFIDFIITMLDITSLALLVELFLSAKKLRKTRAEIAEEEGKKA